MAKPERDASARRYRRQGLGSRPTDPAEEEVLRRGCTGAYLGTFSLRALGFYEARGYERFGRLSGFGRSDASLPQEDAGVHAPLPGTLSRAIGGETVTQVMAALEARQRRGG